MDAKPVLIVHGGAWDIPDALVADHLKGCRTALEGGWEHLRRGGTALDAVMLAVQTMEDNPVFDAGRGAFLNKIGEVELDAAIMDGATLRAGAVAAVQNIANPILLARQVMEKTQHVLLVGPGAQAFAREIEMPLCETADLLVGRELERYHLLKDDPNFISKQVFEKHHPKGTVGAVAMDRYGHLAAATSTGGTPQKMPGRVGDTPIIGAGTFADDQVGAASCTGWGEAIMKILLAKRCVDFLEIGENAQSAAQQGIALLEHKVAGRGGVILIDRKGEIGFANNTPRMAFAFQVSDLDFRVGIDPASQ